jgi:hypothetical protein
MTREARRIDPMPERTDASIVYEILLRSNCSDHAGFHINTRDHGTMDLMYAWMSRYDASQHISGIVTADTFATFA